MKKINVRQIGNNVISVIDNKQYSKSTTKEEREDLFKKVEMYNKRNSDKLFKEITAILTANKVKQEKEIERKLVETKGKITLLKKDKKNNKVINKDKVYLVKELTKIDYNDMNEDELEQSRLDLLELLISKNKKITEQIQSLQSPTERSGEY